MLPETTLALAAEVLEACRARDWRVATAESCTGGLIAAALTHVSGSGDVLDRGFVTYSNAAKMAMLGVQAALLAEHGAVSEQVARGMAAGALTHSDAHVAVAVTGIAGPTGATEGKPVGLVWFGIAERDGPAAACSRNFAGDRAAVRAATVELALRLVLDHARPGAPAASRLPFRGSSPV